MNHQQEAPIHRRRGRTGRGRTPAALAVLLVLGLTAAACSSSSDAGSDGGSKDPAKETKAVAVGKPMTSEEAADAAVKLLGPIKYATGNTTRGIKGKVIKIGGVGDVTDASGQDSYQGLCDGAEARFKRANDEGGVNGYTFDYVGCSDTGTTPDGSREKVKDMVEKEKVFALVPKTSPSGNTGDYLNKEHVPYFGWGVDGDYCGWDDRQFSFPVTGAVTCSDVVPGKALFSSLGLDTYVKGTKKDPKDVKVALIASNDPQSVAAVSSFNSLAPAGGMEVAYKTNSIPAAGAPPLSDYAPLAQDIVASGANVAYMIVPPATIFALAPALRAAGYKGDIILPFADARLLAVVDSIDQAYAETPSMGALAFPSDELDQITKDLKAVGSDAPADGLGSVTSYVAADMFIEALKEVKGPLTAESFIKVINEGWEYGGIDTVSCKTYWPGDHVVTGNCSAIVQFDAKSKSIKPIAPLSETGDIYLFPIS